MSLDRGAAILIARKEIERRGHSLRGELTANRGMRKWVVRNSARSGGAIRITVHNRTGEVTKFWGPTPK